MTHNRRLTSTALVGLIAVLVVAAAMTGPAAAATAFTLTADNSDNAATTDHTVSIDSDTSSGDVKHVHVRYAESDVTGAEAADIELTAAGTAQTIDSVTVQNNGTTLNVTLATAYTLDSTVAETFEVNTTNSTVENPQDAGDYTVTMALVDGTGADITSLSGTFTVTQGPTPSVNETSSDFSSSAAVTNYTSDNTSVVIQTEANSDAQELRLTDGAGTTYATFSNVTTISSATSTAAGTYEFQLTEADFRSVPMAINENAPVHVEIVNTSDSSAPTNNFEGEIQNGDEVSQVAVTHDAINDSGVGPDVEFDAADSGMFSFLSFGGDDYAVSDTRDINGSATTVYVTFVDDEAATAFSEASTLRTDASEYTDGQLHSGQSAHVAGEYVAVYQNQAGDLHPDGSSYVVYNKDADRLAYHLGEQHENESTVDVEAENDAAPLRVRFGLATPSDLDADEDSFLSFGLVVPLAGVPAAKRRQGV